MLLSDEVNESIPSGNTNQMIEYFKVLARPQEHIKQVHLDTLDNQRILNPDNNRSSTVSTTATTAISTAIKQDNPPSTAESFHLD